MMRLARTREGDGGRRDPVAVRVRRVGVVVVVEGEDVK